MPSKNIDFFAVFGGVGAQLSDRADALHVLFNCLGQLKLLTNQIGPSAGIGVVFVFRRACVATSGRALFRLVGLSPLPMAGWSTASAGL